MRVCKIIISRIECCRKLFESRHRASSIDLHGVEGVPGMDLNVLQGGGGIYYFTV